MQHRPITISAPAKALIMGEYAVLEGHPAVVQALARFARVTLTPDQPFTVTAPPLIEQPLDFGFDDQQQFQWQKPDNEQRLPFVGPLMRALGDWRRHYHESWSLELNTRDFFISDNGSTGHKIGLGSSAALTVALAATWFGHRHPGQTFDRQRWLPLLVKLHRDLQGGSGSGVDIAASLYGGLSAYQIREDNYQARPLSWPDGVECIWIWLGHSASTRVFLGRMQDFRNDQPGEYAAHLQTMGELAQAGCQAFTDGSAQACLDTISAYGQAMQALGDAADAPVYTDAHRRLAQLAAQHGVAFKPSGAGGGDIALAAATDTKALAAFARQVQSAGYGLLELTPAEQGVVIDRRPAR